MGRAAVSVVGDFGRSGGVMCGSCASGVPFMVHRQSSRAMGMRGIDDGLWLTYAIGFGVRVDNEAGALAVEVGVCSSVLGAERWKHEDGCGKNS